jgi:DNA-binding transcriptional ArsR family regulator
MARAPSNADAFTAIAEPRRRELLNLLARGDGDQDVSALVEKLGWTQPQVSKHLGVLRAVGLVSVVRRGKRRMYSLNGEELKTVYDWVRSYERFWDHQLLRVKERAEGMKRERDAVEGLNKRKASP